MSAFIVTNTHIASIAASYVYNVTLHKERSPLPTEIIKVANIFAKANKKSVDLSYNEDNALPVFTGYENCSFSAGAQLLKLIDCLDYQCSEFNAWPRTKAYKMLNELSLAILDNLVRDTQDYSDSAWAI